MMAALASELYKELVFEEDMKPEQEKALDYLLASTTVMAVLPTGYGKSRIYGALPLMKDKVSIVFGYQQ